jgi:MFS family permease
MIGSVPPQTAGGQSSNKRAYYHLYFAQVLALVSTGIATVALALLAYNLAGDDAGAVLGTAFAIKMLAYLGIPPIAVTFVERLPRRALLVGLDLARATVVLALPFVTQVWQVYVLIFAFQAASAVFTPTFQATIPDLLPQERTTPRRSPARAWPTTWKTRSAHCWRRRCSPSSAPAGSSSPP